jgi:histidinol-phosphate aminotransferase
MSRFFAARLSGRVPYVPGEQPRDAQFIKLNTNESPFPPSPAVQRLLASPRPETALQLYPDPQMAALGEAFANSCGVSPQNVFCANGSDEALAFAFLAFGEKGVAFADITYGFYRVWAELFSLDAKIVPLQDDFR